MTLSNLRINLDRLVKSIEDLAEIGAIDGGGVCRMALSDEDRQGRDLVVSWMHELGLDVTIDQIGNVIGIRTGLESGKPVIPDHILIQWRVEDDMTETSVCWPDWK